MKVFILSDQEHPIRVSVAGHVERGRFSPREDPLQQALGEDVYSQAVVVSMRDVEALDSSGVGWLLSCQKRFRTSGGTFVLHSLSPLARRVLQVLNMQLVFKIADDEPSALKLIENASSNGGEEQA